MIGGAQTLKNSAVFTEIESEFWAEIGNSTIFPPESRWSQKKKKKKVFTEIKSDFSAQNQVISKKKKKRSSPKLSVFSAETVSFAVTLLFNYCYVRNYWKKLQLNIVRLCCHNFLSLVEFWLGGARAPPLATPMLPSRIYITLGHWHFEDFRNLFLPNVDEDHKKS